MKRPKIHRMHTVDGEPVPFVDGVNTYEAYSEMLDALLSARRDLAAEGQSNRLVEQALEKAGVEL